MRASTTLPRSELPATEIGRLRLQSQRLTGPAFATTAEVVRWFGAVQGQEFPASLLALANRLPPMAEADIEAAIAERAVLRTWPMRGTVHYVPTEDTRWMVELMGTRVISRFRSYHHQLGLDEAVFAQGRAIFERALRNGEPVTRRDLYALLDEAGISPKNMRGVFIASYLAHQGLIASGPRIGKQPTFVWLDAWAPTLRTLERDAALVEMAERYFRSHGPATLKDFVWWTGLTVAEAREGLDGIAASLTSAVVDGVTYYWRDERPVEALASTVWLLPPFDEFLVAYKDRSASLDPTLDVTWPRADAIGSHILVIDGQVVGYWTRTLKRTVVEVDVTTFRRLSADEAAGLDAALARYGAFVGRAVAHNLTPQPPLHRKKQR